MTIEEMKAKGFKRYTAYIEKHIVTKEVEVWAENWDDAEKILENTAEELSDSAFEDWESPEVQEIYENAHPPRRIAAAQSMVTDCNEDFYKSEE